MPVPGDWIALAMAFVSAAAVIITLIIKLVPTRRNGKERGEHCGGPLVQCLEWRQVMNEEVSRVHQKLGERLHHVELTLARMDERFTKSDERFIKVLDELKKP